MNDIEAGEDNLNFTEQEENDTTEITQSTTNSFRKSTPVHMRNITSDCDICNDVIANGRPAGVRSCPNCKRKWAKAK